MDQEPSTPGQELNDDSERTPEQVRAEIEQTREQLGDTVAALAEKTDVKGQAKRATEQAKASVAEKTAGIKNSMEAKRQEFVSSAHDATPASVGEAGQRASGLARENSAALIAVATFGLGLLIGRRRNR